MAWLVINAFTLLLLGEPFVRIFDVGKNSVELMIIGEHPHHVGEEFGGIVLLNLAVVDQGAEGAASSLDASVVIKSFLLFFGLNGSRRDQ